MTLIERRDLASFLQSRAVPVAELRADPAFAGMDLEAADLDHDGRLAGALEGAALFDVIERTDGDADRTRLRAELPDGHRTRAGAALAALGDRLGALPRPAEALRRPTAAELERNTARLRGGDALDAPELRQRFGIPAPDGSGLDGFRAESGGQPRRVGLLRRTHERTPELSVDLAGRRLSGEQGAAGRAAVARQLEAVARVDPAADPALVLAVAVRESGGQAFSASPRRVDSFYAGGLDHLGDDVRSGRIRPPAGFGPWPAGQGATNELGRPVRGAMVPQDELLVAYGLELERSRATFERHVRQVFSDRADQLLGAMTPAARRAWTQVTFAAPNGASYREGGQYGRTFGARTALELLRAEMEQGRAAGLNDLFTSEALNRYTIVQRGRVTAAEAESFERTLLAR